VRKTATRSPRGADRPSRLENCLGYRTVKRLASSGCCTYDRKDSSPLGSRAFHSSLRAIGTSTSLNSGLPSRETCTHGPDSECSSFCLSRMRSLRRLAAPQMPSTALGSDISLGVDLFAVSELIGTCSTIEWQLSVASVSTPVAFV